MARGRRGSRARWRRPGLVSPCSGACRLADGEGAARGRLGRDRRLDTYTLFGRPRQESELLCALHAARGARMLPSDEAGPHGVARVLCSQELVVDPRDVSVGIHLLRVGFWEWWVSKAIADVMRPGTVCVDVGANFGYFTALMMALGAAKVIAVEPQPALARRLRTSAALNGWDHRLEVLPVAVGDRRGRADLNVPAVDNLGGSSLCASGGNDTIRDVMTVTLDEVLGVQPPPHVVKIDAEGSEIAIWEGMQETLRRAPGAHVFVEVTVNAAAEHWLPRVVDQGYPLRYVAHDGEIRPFRPDRLGDEPLWMLYLHRG